MNVQNKMHVCAFLNKLFLIKSGIKNTCIKSESTSATNVCLMRLALVGTSYTFFLILIKDMNDLHFEGTNLFRRDSMPEYASSLSLIGPRSSLLSLDLDEIMGG